MGHRAVDTPMFEDHSFALCLTHDVDRPYKTYQSIYYALRDGRGSHLADLHPRRNPYWQFGKIMALEDDLGIRSAFYFLNEPPLLEKSPRAWVNPGDWIETLGRYDVAAPAIVEVMRELEAGGWEVGLHGSYRSCGDEQRLRHEKEVLEACLGEKIVGGRQHHLNLSIPGTWRYYASIGLRYDASLGSADEYGFQNGYRPLRPFDTDFTVFPLTVMDQALPDPGRDFDAAWTACADLLEEAADNDAVMTALWHPRYFSETDFPGHRRLYRRLIERALEMGAWVGTPAACYRSLELDRDCTTELAP